MLRASMVGAAAAVKAMGEKERAVVIFMKGIASPAPALQLPLHVQS